MIPQDENRDEEQLASLLASTNRDAAPPDRAILDRLREQSTAAFQASLSQEAQPQKRGRFMFSGLMHGLAVAAAVLIGVSVFVWLHAKNSGVAFGEVMQNVSNAATMHVRVTRQGKT